MSRCGLVIITFSSGGLKNTDGKVKAKAKEDIQRKPESMCRCYAKSEIKCKHIMLSRNCPHERWENVNIFK